MFSRSIVLSLPLAVLSCASSPDGSSAPSVARPVVWSESTPVGRIVADRPDTMPVFELVGIDTCCGGERPLGQAAAERGVDPRRLLSALAVVGTTRDGGAARDWNAASTDDLLDHIVAFHHAATRRDLARLSELAATAARVHGPQDRRYIEVEAIVAELRPAMLEHLAVEEEVAFPAVRRLEAGAPREDLDEDLDEDLAALRDDHDEVGDALRRLRAATDGFRPTDDSCAVQRELLAGLERFERLTLEHVHLENNVLFPRVEAVGLRSPDAANPR